MSAPLPDESNLWNALLAERDPAAPCILLVDGQVVTYGDVIERSALIAGGLRADGVGRGDRVLLHVDKSVEALLVFLGCARLGAVFLPLNAAYRHDEVAYFVGDAEPSVMIGRPDDAEWFSGLAEGHGAVAYTLGADGRGTWTDAVDAADGWAEVASTSADDLAALVYTSGTTGRSKGAMITHGNLVSNAAALRDLWGFTSTDVLIHALPIFHVHGLFVATNTSLLTGIPMRWHQGFDTDAVIDDFATSTVFMGVPTMYTRLLANPRLSPESTSHMRLFVSGSAPLLAETHVEFEARTGHRVLERYGMTETSMITSNPLDGQRRAGTVGFPLPRVEVRIDGTGESDDDGANGIGGVEVRGPNVFAGYWRRPDTRATEFTADGWFKTGDVGRFDADGYLELVGRSKDLVISGGYNVYPKEIELLLDEWPGVVESAVIGVPHPDFGEGVTAVLTVKADGPTVDIADVQNALRSRLAPFKVPKSVQIVDELPRNAMGKVQKNLLRDRYKDLYRS